MDWRFLVSLIFAVGVALFAVQNADPVSVRFLSWDTQISQALVILISAVFGAAAALLLSLVRWVRLKTKNWRLTKTIAALEEENKLLKNQAEETSAASMADIISQDITGAVDTENVETELEQPDQGN